MKVKPRYLVKLDYPFSKYKKGDLIHPNKKQLETIKKFAREFEDKSITYEVVKKEDNNIISVRCLHDNKTYSIGDTVIYTVSHLDYYVRFKIAGFNEREIYKDIILVCFNIVKEDRLADACGLGRISMYDSSIDYGKIVDLS